MNGLDEQLSRPTRDVPMPPRTDDEPERGRPVDDVGRDVDELSEFEVTVTTCLTYYVWARDAAHALEVSNRQEPVRTSSCLSTEVRQLEDEEEEESGADGTS